MNAENKAYIYYLSPPRRCCNTRRLSVCLLATSRRNYWSDLSEYFIRYVFLDDEVPSYFGSHRISLGGGLRSLSALVSLLYWQRLANDVINKSLFVINELSRCYFFMLQSCACTFKLMLVILILKWYKNYENRLRLARITFKYRPPRPKCITTCVCY